MSDSASRGDSLTAGELDRDRQRAGLAALMELAEATSTAGPLSAGSVAAPPKLRRASVGRFLSFAIGGGLIAVLGAVVLTVLVRGGISVLVAQAAQLTLTLILNFIYNYKFTWRERPRDQMRRQAGLFALTRGATQLASWAGFAVLARAGLEYELANLICLAAAMVVNFVSSDKIVFRAKSVLDEGDAGGPCADYGNLNGVAGGGGYHGSFRGDGSAGVASRQVAAGALNDGYDVPRITFKRNEARGLLISSVLVSAWVAWHLGWEPLVLIACAFPSIAFRAAGWLLSWFDMPSTVNTAATQRRIDQMRVTVAVPVYNEDPGLLDRCLWALINQSRPPQLVWVVDDGSRTDYTVVQRHWEGTWSCGTEVRWTRQYNQGKRRAHALVFASNPDADIFITVDSDTTLEHRAIEEGLKPFQNRSVMSVAGIEMGFNAYTNFLTRLQCSLQLFAQAVIGAAWSYAGDMYTNRGPFALYRASVIREFLAVYSDETFFGRRMVLGDDSLLALCASARGRSVQQLTAFGLTMWPESLSHHLRQRIRWARGRAVRNFWRTKYRPVMSYCWWFTVCGIYDFIFSIGLVTVLILTWPASEATIVRLAIALVVLSVPNSLRTLCFRRSDETVIDRLLLVLIRPAAGAWSSIVLARIVRMWGTVTLMRQGWTTRQNGAELVLEPRPVTVMSVPHELVPVREPVP
jgi:hyaluronan synthase